MAHIGIDIGTSYSSVCILNENGQPERVKIATGTSVYGDSYSLPSAVFLEEDGRLLLGQAAMANRMRAPQNFKAEFKRDLGQINPYLLGRIQYLPEDLYKEFFIYIKKCVEDYTHESVTSATVTFPAMFNTNKRKLIENAAKRAGLLDVKLIDEPGAAAYCYLSAGKLSEGDTLLVYDLGGGTFDLSLMCLKDGKFEQLAQPMGNPRLGGADIDKLIFNDIMARIGEEKMAPIRSNSLNFSRFAAMMLEMAIKAKHHLSNSNIYNDVIPVGYDALEYKLTRDKLDAMITPMIDDTMRQVQALLQSAGLTAKDISKVLLVGGATRTPLVADMLANQLGQDPLKDIDPELAVCTGAATSVSSEDMITPKKEEELAKTPEGQFILGSACYHGKRGKKQDYDMAVFWLKQSSERGNTDAQYLLGLCYENGLSVTKNSTAAAGYLEKAAKGGNAEAQLRAAQYYENGNGVTKDIDRSINYYSKAASQGYGEAMLALGRIYSNTDYITAREWYIKAANAEIESAKDGIAAMDAAIQQKKMRDEQEAVRKAQEEARAKAEQEAQRAREAAYSAERSKAQQEIARLTKKYRWPALRFICGWLGYGSLGGIIAMIGAGASGWNEDTSNYYIYGAMGIAYAIFIIQMLIYAHGRKKSKRTIFELRKKYNN